MKKITMYTGPLCNYCEAAKRLLARNNAPYNEIDISKVDGAMDEMIKKANGKRTIPQIFFDDQHIGGYDEVRALEKENKLQDLLNTYCQSSKANCFLAKVLKSFSLTLSLYLIS